MGEFSSRLGKPHLRVCKILLTEPCHVCLVSSGFTPHHRKNIPIKEEITGRMQGGGLFVVAIEFLSNNSHHYDFSMKIPAINTKKCPKNCKIYDFMNIKVMPSYNMHHQFKEKV